MMSIRIGLLGLGRLGRQIYGLALQDSRYEIAAIAESGQPEVLHHLLQKSFASQEKITLNSNYFACNGMDSRLLTTEHTEEIPWDALDVSVVIDASGHHYTADQVQPHIDNGAKRIVLSALPAGEIDRVILCGVNEDDATVDDRVISAGSSSTTATALALKIILGAFQIEHASMTSVHAYTSDQRLQDDAGQDYRRSRSGATNIIPNDTPALAWVQRVLPEINGRLTGYALNVPVQIGSMLDIDVSLVEKVGDVSVIQDLFAEAEKNLPHLIETTNEPIVSSDVIGSSRSLLVDLRGMTRSGKNLVKILAWHETLGHAHRMLEVVSLYHGLSSNQSMAQAQAFS